MCVVVVLLVWTRWSAGTDARSKCFAHQGLDTASSLTVWFPPWRGRLAQALRLAGEPPALPLGWFALYPGSKGMVTPAA
jgi:hypothetical protein